MKGHSLLWVQFVLDPKRQSHFLLDPGQLTVMLKWHSGGGSVERFLQ